MIAAFFIRIFGNSTRLLIHGRKNLTSEAAHETKLLASASGARGISEQAVSAVTVITISGNILLEKTSAHVFHLQQALLVGGQVMETPKIFTT
jgi:hypothetical protein